MVHIRGDFEASLERGADLVKDGLSLGERDTDLIDLVLNAVRDDLDKPGVTLDEVIANHGDDPAEFRTHWDSWS